MEGLKFSEQQKTEYLIEVGAGQDDALNRCIAPPFDCGRLQLGISLDLEPEIGRGIYQNPRFSITGDGCLQLHAGRGYFRVRSGECAGLAGAIPLGEAATGSCPQQFEFQQRLNFRRGVAVDLAAQANFLKIRTGPCLH
jgi:hypothetical protein